VPIIGTCLALIAGTTVGVLLATSAGANVGTSTFEGDDGNFAVDTAGNTDWAALNAQQQANLSVKADLLSGQTDNSFGNGTKTSDTTVSVVSGQIPNNKADLGNSYITSETLANQHVMMYLGVTRVTTSGTVNLDIEVNKAAQPDLTTPGTKTLNRTVGDVLISYDFQGGSQKPTLAIRTWTGTVWGAPTPVTSANGEAEVNRVALANPLAVLPSPETAPAFTFGEAALDLTGLGIVPAGACSPFSSAYVKSRASDAFTSAVKDFIAPQSISLSNCGTIVIKKVTVPSPDPTTTSFPFTLTGGPSALNKSFSLLDGGSNTTTEVKQGSGYVAAETVPANWALTSATCSDGSPVTNIDVAGGETVTCTFTNTLQTGAIKVTKTHKNKAAGGIVPESGVTFTVNNVSKQTGADGTVCFDGLLFNDYTVHETVPAGEVPDANDKVVKVDNAATCTDSPYNGESVSFLNTPLTNIAASADSQVDGGTSTTFTCKDANGVVIASGTTAANGDGSVGATNLKPGVYTCEYNIDP
jgi:hypothetical protein